MRRFLQDYCWCWFGRPVTPTVEKQKKKQLEDEIDSYEEPKYTVVDSKDWEQKDIKHPYKIKDQDLTKEHFTPEGTEDDYLSTLGYRKGDAVGKGGFGNVSIMYRIIKSGTTPETGQGKELACKVVPLSKRITGEKIKEKMADFKNELFVLVKSNHRNIVRIRDHFILNNHCYLLMEYANGGNLNEECKKRAPYKEIKAKKYFAQISSAIYYLHSRQGIAHLDLKLSNILVFCRFGDPLDEHLLKVTDFGLSRLRIDDVKGVIKEKTPKGTLSFMSPQVLRLYILDKLDEESIFGDVKPFNPFIADIWSLGVCLYLLLFREYPFDQENDPHLMRHVLDAQRQKQLTYKEDVIKYLTQECKDMVEDCLEPNPHKRLTIQNICSHIWFEDVFTIKDLTDPKL